MTDPSGTHRPYVEPTLNAFFLLLACQKPTAWGFAPQVKNTRGEGRVPATQTPFILEVGFYATASVAAVTSRAEVRHLTEQRKKSSVVNDWAYPTGNPKIGIILLFFSIRKIKIIRF